MRAVRIVDGHPRVERRPTPTARDGEALVRVLLAGICGTDLEISRGYLGFRGTPGHEFVGVVEGGTAGEWVGRRVVGEINAACGECRTCREGRRKHCPERTVLGIDGRDGAFADLLTLPTENLHAVPGTVADSVAVFAEPLAAAYEILESCPISPKTRSLVLGDGRLGQLCAAVLARAGSAPLVCGRHTSKLERLARRGFEVTDRPLRLREKFDLVVEATGSPAGLETALGLAAPRGTVVLKSTYHGRASIALAGAVIDEIRIVGSRCGPFGPALAHLEEEPSVVEGMVSAVYSLDDVAAAFERASDADTLKVLLSITPSS